jgi:hypothetical protein
MTPYLVLYVRPYDFQTKEGERCQGATVTYLDLTMQATNPGEHGFAPLQLSIDHEVSKSFTAAPGYYDLEFRQRRGKDGKPQIVLTGGQLIARAPLEDAIGG